MVIEGGASDNRIGTDGRSVDDAASATSSPGSNNDGIDIIRHGTDGNIVAGNFIGTDVTGTLALGIAGDRRLSSPKARHPTGSGSTRSAGRRSGDEGNVISGNCDGVHFDSATTATRSAGNEIGSDAAGSASRHRTGRGDRPSTIASDNTIGGTTAVAGNLITDNGGPGVVVGTDTRSVGNQITANRIFGNTGQAIDLGDDGVTDNSHRTAPGTEQPSELPDHRHDRRRPAPGLAGRQHARHDLPHRFLRQRRLLARRFGRGRGLPRLAGGDDRQPGPGRPSTSRSPRRPGCRSSRPRPPTPRATPPKSRPSAGRRCRRLRFRFARCPTSSLASRDQVGRRHRDRRTPMPGRSTRCGT